MIGRKTACVAVTAMLTIAATHTGHAERLSLSQALQRAENHPEILLATEAVAAAKGRQTQASTIAHNPELSGGLGPRFAGGDTLLDFEVGVTQTLELGDKRGHRTALATGELQAARARLLRARQLVRLRVRRAFLAAVAASAVVRAIRDAETIAVALKATADERLARGAGTQLEVNLAAAGVGRAKRQRLAAEQRYLAARSELSAAVGVEAHVELEPDGELGLPPVVAQPVGVLIEQAIASRADLMAAKQDRDAAATGVELADSLAVPDLSIGATYAHEEEADQWMVVLSIDIPLWNRSRGERARARAQLRQSAIVVSYARMEIEREVRTAYQRYRDTREAVVAFKDEAVGTLQSNLDLAREAFEKGKLSMLDFNLLRREFVDVQLAYLDAVLDLIDAHSDLERAVGERLMP